MVRFATTFIITAFALTVLDVPGRSLAAQQWDVERPDGSRDVAERYREVLHSNPLSDHALDGLIREYTTEGGLTGLRAEYQQRIAGSNDAQDHVILARLYQRSDQPAAALRVMDRAVELGFDTAGGYLLRGTLRTTTEDDDGALADFETALSHGPRGQEQIEILRAIGDVHLARGRTTDALTSYRRIAEAAPRDRYVRQELGAILYEAGFREEAADAYREVVRLAGTNTRDRADALRELATLEEELQRYEEAIEDWRTVRSLTTAGNWLRLEAENGILRSYRAWGRLDVLLESLEQRVEDGSRDSFVLLTRARILRELARPDEAIGAYRLAIARMGRNSDARRELADTLISMGDFDGARAEVEILVASNVDDLDALFSLIDALLAAERHFDASFLARSYEAVLWDAPDRVWQLVRTYRAIGDDERAEQAVGRLLALRPDDVEVLFELAEAAIKQGDADDALALLEPITSGDDTLRIGQVLDRLRALGADDRADAVLDTARARFPDDETLSLHWLRSSRLSAGPTRMGAARALLLATDDWEVAMAAFTVYHDDAQAADLLAWVATDLGHAFEAEPDDYRLGRAALMAQLTAGDGSAASRTLALLNATSQTGQQPGRWVTATFERWPEPGAVSLLDRLGRDDPDGQWRYQLTRVALLVDAGQDDQAVALIDELVHTHPTNPQVLYQAGRALLALTSAVQRARGCGLVGRALEQDSRSMTFRLGAIDCLAEIGREPEAYHLAVEGLGLVREVQTAELMFDALVRTASAKVDPVAFAAECRAAMQHAGPELTRWLDRRLDEWAELRGS